MPCQVVCNHIGAGLGKLLFRFIEGVRKIAFNIEFAGQRFVDVDGDYDFRFDKSRTRKIARIF